MLKEALFYPDALPFCIAKFEGTFVVIGETSNNNKTYFWYSEYFSVSWAASAGCSLNCGWGRVGVYMM